MKFILHILSIIVILLSIAFALAFSANQGYLNNEVQYLAKYYLKSQGYNIKLNGLHYKQSHLKINKILLYQNNLYTEINNLDTKIEFNITSWKDVVFGNIDYIKTSSFSEDVKIIGDINNEIILQSNLSANYEYSFKSGHAHLKVNMQNINLSTEYDLQNGVLEYKYDSNSKHNHDLSMIFDNDKYIKLTAAIHQNSEVLISSKVKEMPIILYKIGNSFVTNNKLLSFLNKFIQDGKITHGKIDINLDEEFYRTSILKEHHIHGEIHVVNASISYFPTLPNVHNMHFDVQLSGSKTHIDVTEAVNSGINLYNGKIDMDFQGLDDTILYISAKGKGPADGLIRFIDDKVLDKLKQSNIDLTTIQGQTIADVDIKIPLKANTTNIYDIKAKINNANLSVLKNQINLTNATLQGSYLGDKILISGAGKVNDIPSDLDFVYYLKNDKNGYHELNVVSHVNTSGPIALMPNLSDIVVLDNGVAKIHIKYYFQNQTPYIKVAANLDNIEVFIEKLGIRSGVQDKATFNLSGQFDNIHQGNISFRLFGNNDLDINGNIELDAGEVFLHLPKIIHDNTNVEVKTVITKSGAVATNLKGNILDLSRSDMLSFLKKQEHGVDTELNIKLSELKLKNNIWLHNVNFYIQCDNNRCFNGLISSNVGQKSLTAKLSAIQDKETWDLQSGNAGALLKGIGAYDSMKSGQLHLILNTKRKEVDTGAIIPILDGRFKFTNFKLTNTPFLTKIVSFASLPGLVSLITSNNDLVFASMSGKFHFVNNVLHIDELFAEGPYFNFALKGTIDFNTRIMQFSGHVNPALFGVNNMINKIPVIGKIFSGTKKSQGITSAPFTIKDKF